LDVVAGEIIGLPREDNPVMIEAQRRGLHPTRLSEVDVIGADIADLRIPDYKLPTTFASGRGLANTTWWQRALMPLFRDGLNVRPEVIEKACIACGACHKACPVKAISMVNGRGPRKYARINDKDCIRCYCCHEMCPRDAIELKSSLLYRIVNR
jgi:ferredoxin